MADSILFDVELVGDKVPTDLVVVHAHNIPTTPFPIKHFLDIALNDLKWVEPWIELRSQTDGSRLHLAGYRMEGTRWNKFSEKGLIPEKGDRVDLCLYASEPKILLDSLLV